MSDEPPNEAQVAIDALYDAALTPQRWPQALHKLSDMVNAASAHYMLLDSRRHGAPIFGACFSRAPACSRLIGHVSVEDAPCAAHSLPSSAKASINCPHLLARHGLHELPLQQERLLKYGENVFLGMQLEQAGPLRAVICLQRSADTRASGRAEEHLPANFGAHLQRAARIHLRLQEITSHARLLEDLANTLAGAVFIVDRNSTIYFHNRAAAGLLQDLQSPLTIDHGRLVSREPAAARMLARYTDLAANHGIGNAMHLPGPHPDAASTATHNALICPLPPGLSSAPAQRDPLIMVLASTAQPHARVHAYTLRTLFGLTEAEANLGIALLQGQQLDEYSLSRGVSITTLRSQLRQLLAKTGTRRQAELVSLLAAVPTVGARMRPRAPSKRTSI